MSLKYYRTMHHICTHTARIFYNFNLDSRITTVYATFIIFTVESLCVKNALYEIMVSRCRLKHTNIISLFQRKCNKCNCSKPHIKCDQFQIQMIPDDSFLGPSKI